MRSSLARFLLRMVRWLDPDAIRLRIPRDAVYHAALHVTRRIEQTEVTASAENKHHQAYGSLRREFPRAETRDIFLAIEAAIEDL